MYIVLKKRGENMPNIKSAKKRVKTSAKKNIANTEITSSMKTAIKKFEKEVTSGDKKVAEEKLNTAIKRIDKAAASGLIHKNNAARKKSRLTQMKNNME